MAMLHAHPPANFENSRHVNARPILQYSCFSARASRMRYGSTSAKVLVAGGGGRGATFGGLAKISRYDFTKGLLTCAALSAEAAWHLSDRAPRDVRASSAGCCALHPVRRPFAGGSNEL